MPFTAKQRRFFHAAAARHEKGMSSLADEADSLAREGKERPPVKEHMQLMEGGGMVCRHCGGEVDADGYSMGGEIEGPDDMDGEDTAMREGETDETPQQWSATQRMRKRSLADALASRRDS